MPIIHCLAYLLQFKTFRTFNRIDPKFDLINIKSQQRNHSLTVHSLGVVTHYVKVTLKKFLILIASLFSANASSQMEFDLGSVLKIERRDMIVMEIDSYLNKKCAHGEKIDKLNESQKILWIIENLEREINNGGFHQFYWNSSGNYANETIDALIQIGAEKTAEIVKKANSEFKNGSVPKDRVKRHNELQLIRNKAEENWNNLDSEFYEYNDDLTEMLIVFVLKNKSDFEK